MKIAVLDCDSICYAIGNPNKVVDDQGNPVKVLSPAGNMVFQYTEKTKEELNASADWMMNNILTKSEATHYLGYMKGSGTTLDRLSINPDYKANRKQDPPRWWHYVQQYLFNQWGCFYVDGMEVDDAVNITRLQLPNSFIVAIDGDLLGLEGTHYNWKTQQWVTNTKEQANKKFWSDMICGQKGDNVKGLPNKGQKYTEELFEKLNYFANVAYAELVYSAYLVYYGNVEKATKEFYKNYISLKILDQKEGFVVPEPIEFKKKELSLI